MTTTRQSAPTAHREPWTSVSAGLERERAELLAELELTADGPHEPTATTGSGETEHISSGIEQGVQAALDARTAIRLAEIEDALRRLDAGTYGLCEHCGSEITAARLEAIPHVRFCLPCQKRHDAEHRGWETR